MTALIRSVVFRPEEVRAALEGRQRQFRRPIKGLTVRSESDGVKQRLFRLDLPVEVALVNRYLAERRRHPLDRIRSPFGAPGTLLYVKETWAQPYAPTPADSGTIYLADGPDYLSPATRRHNWSCERERHHWRHAITLPRWAARLWLGVEEVRVQRVQEASEEDAEAEGVEFYVWGHGFVTEDELRADPGYRCGGSYRAGLENAWAHRYDKPADFGSSWQTNPFTWVVTYRVTERPEWA